MSNTQTLNPTQKHQPNKWLKIPAALICAFSLITALVMTYQHISFKSDIYESSKEELRQLTLDATRDIELILKDAMQAAEGLAQGLSNGEINPTNMHNELKSVLEANNNYFGGTITFAPYAYNADTRLYSAYYSKTGVENNLEFQQLADVYDYTTPEYDWYVVPMEKGNRWGEPYWDEAGKTYMTTYSAVFYQKNSNQPKGVVTIDISMGRIKDIIESLDIGPSGFGALTTRGGNYLYHPNYEYVQQRLNIRDVASDKSDKNRLLIADMALRGEGGVLDHISTTTGQSSWLIFETVPISGWSLQNTFIKEDLEIDVDHLRQQIIWIMIATIIFLTSLAAMVLKVNWASPRRVWLFTAFLSFLLVGGVSVIWYLALTFHLPDNTVSGVKISDKATLRSLMLDYSKISADKHLTAPIFIPTGLYLDSIEFNNANDVLVTGRLWQKYPIDYPKELIKGVQIGHAKGVKFVQTDTYSANDHEVVQWSFQADLRVKLDYSRYPLEVEQIAMKVLPLDSDQNLILVPDLDAYRLTTATLLPGLDKGVFIPGWKITESFFLLRTLQKNTNFGIKQNFDLQTLPTFHYVIGVKRVFLDAFISNLTPLIIVAIVLFSVVLLSPVVEIGRLLSICVAVFFVVVFSHIDIRKHISAGEIFYLEFFFFVTYFTIILAPINAFRIALSMPSSFFEKQNGLLAKAIYWPSILGTFLIISVIKFY